VGATKVRLLTVPGPGFALQIARPLDEVDHTMHRITLFLLLIAAGGIAVAVALGLAAGIPVGVISGYVGGTLDLLVQRGVDLLLAFPGFLLALTLIDEIAMLQFFQC